MEGFTLAGSKKDVQVSSEALNKAALLFSDAESPKPAAKPTGEKFTLSFLAGGKSVNISESALSKATKLFEDSSPTMSIKATPLDAFNTSKFLRGALSTDYTAKPQLIKQRVNLNSISVPNLKRKQQPLLTEKRKKNSVSKQLLKSFGSLTKTFPSSGLIITAYNACGFKFNCDCFHSETCQCEKLSRSGWQQCLDQLKVNKMNAPVDWVQQHYRLLVWKYAGYSRKISTETFSLGRVYKALGKRFHEEFKMGKQGIIDKISQRDEGANVRMVLCIGKIIDKADFIEIELTDGWSSINALIRPFNPIEQLVKTKKLREGMKINLIMAELVEGGLNLHYNCLRRARWHTKLGKCKTPRPFPVNIKSLKANGGPIGCIIVHVCKIYPVLYYDTTNKTYSKSKEGDCQVVEIKVVDALGEINDKFKKKAILVVKCGNVERFLDIIQPGYKYSFYNLMPNAYRSENHIVLTYGRFSQYYDWNTKQKELQKPDKLITMLDKANSERCAVGIVLDVIKDNNNLVVKLVLGNLELQNIEVVLHDSLFFAKQYAIALRKALIVKNVKVSRTNGESIRCITTYNSEISGSIPKVYFDYATKMMNLWEAYEEMTINNSN